MTLIVSVAVAVFISLLVMLVLLNVKTVHYRAEPKSTEQLLQWMLLGQANENQWRIFCEIPIRHHPQLEVIRQRCADIDEEHFIGQGRSGFMLDSQGLESLKAVLTDLQSLSADSDNND